MCVLSVYLKSSHSKLGIIWDSESLQYHHRGQLKHLKTESVNTVKVLWSKTNFYFVFFSVTKNSLMMDQRNFWGQFATGGPLLRYFSNPLSCVSLKTCGCSNMYSASASCFSGYLWAGWKMLQEQQFDYLFKVLSCYCYIGTNHKQDNDFKGLGGLVLSQT